VIPCRDEEKKAILNFLKEGIQNEGQSQALCRFIKIQKI
jgi:hypothetical protein